MPFHLSETPVLSDQPRLRVDSLGPFQEITILGHSFEELDTSEFEEFLEAAAQAFVDMGSSGKIRRAGKLQ